MAFREHTGGKGVSFFRRYFRYPLEAAGLWLVLAFFRVLPLDLASNVGAFLGRLVGPWLPASRIAEQNLAMAFPEKSAGERQAIVRGMWDNLGRVAGELPHLNEICNPDSGRVELIGPENYAILQRNDAPAIAVSGHFANWEVLNVTALHQGIAIAVIAREPNNPLVARIIDSMRGVSGGERIPKGKHGGRLSLAKLSGGGTVGVLMDQKMNEGIAVDFFGRPAMTADGPALLALRTRSVMVPCRIERLRGARFRVTCPPPVPLPDTGDRGRDVADLTETLNRMLEDWIRQRPEQWFWAHRRWARDLYD